MDDNAHTITPNTGDAGPRGDRPAGEIGARGDLEPPARAVRQPPAGEPWHPIDLILLTLAATSLAASCLLMSPKKYFWCDEVFSWTLVTDQSFGHMLAALAQGADGAPPLFYVIGRLWSHAFGTGELALRSVSCLGFIAAMGVMWAILRRAYGTWPAAIASVTVFATSQSVLYQIAEARFYGLLTALVACAVFLYTRAVWTTRYTRGLFALTALVHAALLYTHLFGVLYSAAILTAWIVADRVQRRPWHAGYLSVVVAWLAFAPWLPSLQRTAAVGKPHSWIPVPVVSDLVNAYGFTLWYFPLTVAAIVGLGVIRTTVLHWAPNGSRQPPTPLWRANVVKVVAGAVVLVAALPYVLAHPLTTAAVRDAWTFSSSLSVLALLVIVVVHQVSFRMRRASPAVELPPPAIVMDESLLIVGCALLGVPVVTFVVSHLGTSIFYDRYLIPASLGVMPIMAHFAWWSDGSIARRGVDRTVTRMPQAIVGAGWATLIMLIAAQPAWVNRHLRAQDRPGTEIEAVVPVGMTVIVEGALDLLPLRQYQRRSDITYTYALDWAAAMDPHSYLGATVEYKLLDIWRQVGYLSASASSGSSVPCAGRPFVVLHSWRHSWYDDRIANDPAFDVQSIGQSWSTWEKSNILLVHPHGSIVPAMCRSSTAVSRPGRGDAHSHLD